MSPLTGQSSCMNLNPSAVSHARTDEKTVLQIDYNRFIKCDKGAVSR